MRGLQSVVYLSLLLGAYANPVEKKSSKFTYKPVRNPAFPPDVVDQLQDATFPKVEAWLAKQTALGKNNNCTLENVAIRREWSDMSLEDRKEYVRAVLCLQKLPSKAAALGAAPGAKSRYDDFVATHMILAGELHNPNTLFPGHRYYIWAYENALRQECGYKGYQPYMNYDRYSKDPVNSLLFDGSEGSMGSNGKKSAYVGVYTQYPRPNDKIPPGDGGGCVTTGPFKDMVVSLGPRGGLPLRDLPRNPRYDGLGSNPRCLRRDVNKNAVMGARANYTYSLIMDHKNVDDFYMRYMGMPYTKDVPYPWGAHTSGHYLIGGDPGGDFYCSPGDPLFYFHHGMLDRLWWIWQMQDPENRINAIPSSSLPTLIPGGRPGSGNNPGDPLHYIIDLGWTAPPVTIESQNDQLGGHGGKYCYIYV